MPTIRSSTGALQARLVDPALVALTRVIAEADCCGAARLTDRLLAFKLDLARLAHSDTGTISIRVTRHV